MSEEISLIFCIEKAYFYLKNKTSILFYTLKNNYNRITL